MVMASVGMVVNGTFCPNFLKPHSNLDCGVAG